MRRLAKTFRNDDYISKRDYQTISTLEIESISFLSSIKNSILLTSTKDLFADTLVGFGCYLHSDTVTKCTLQIKADENIIYTKRIDINNAWNRIGYSWINTDDFCSISITLCFDEINILNLFGLSLDELSLEDQINESISTENICPEINKAHLVPETYYLNHTTSTTNLSLAIISDHELHNNTSTPIKLKKCCYCQRLLPVDKNIRFSSFHNHKSKISTFQNECRSCKKWKINNFFNPDRSKDKLNESSIITRERKILLREPDKIKELKDRVTGEGLKTQVWKRFNKKCFNCETPLKLSEVQLDHTRPLAYLWPIDEYATCLCATCNNNKHDHFPIDFYDSEEKLQQLSTITKLPYEDLVKKDVNSTELERIIDNIEYFAVNLDPKTFKSIKNKVVSLRPDTDLLEILKSKNTAIYTQLTTALNQRPDA